MNLSIEELQKYPYPNLMAEIAESGYSICTIGDHLGIGDHCKEDDAEVWARLRGEKAMLTSEAFGLASLFGVKLEYLFSHELQMFGRNTLAYARWYEKKQKEKREREVFDLWYCIRQELKDKPYLFDFMKIAITCSREQIKFATSELESRKTVVGGILNE